MNMSSRSSSKRSRGGKGAAQDSVRRLASGKLCYDCLRRQGLSESSARSYSKKGSDCSLCGGIISSADSVVEKIWNELSGYEYGSFLVGARISQSLLDREDELRSELKIRGRENLKTQATHTIGRILSEKAGRPVNFRSPDVTIIVSLPDGAIEIQSKSIWLSGRYVKNSRGIPQRDIQCPTCNGIGCANCDYKGKLQTTIQTIICEFLKNRFLAKDCSFIWFGSEDENSLVLGNGRPFYAEVKDPKRRQSAPLATSFSLGPVVLNDLDFLNAKPKAVPQFTIRARTYLVPNAPTPEIRKDEIERNFSNTEVQVRLSKKFKVVSRHVASVTVLDFEGEGPHVLEINCDGGIPIKKFVMGDENESTVWPNLSQFIHGFTIDAERPFDILEVQMSDDPRRSVPSGRKSRGRKRGQRKEAFEEIVEEQEASIYEMEYLAEQLQKNVQVQN